MGYRDDMDELREERQASEAPNSQDKHRTATDDIVDAVRVLFAARDNGKLRPQLPRLRDDLAPGK